MDSEELEEFSKFNNSNFPILSVYLGGGKMLSTSKLLVELLVLLDLHLGKAEKKVFGRDIKKIEKYLGEKGSAKGVRSFAFFCAGEKMFKVLEFQFPLEPLCVVCYSPYIYPVTENCKALSSKKRGVLKG